MKKICYAYFILKPENYDEHWKPVSLLCGLCHIDYNHIIKQEDLENDIAFHLKKLGFGENETSSRKIQLRRDNKSIKEFEHIFDYFKNTSLEKVQLNLVKVSRNLIYDYLAKFLWELMFLFLVSKNS